jgi:hypothetical protein
MRKEELLNIEKLRDLPKSQLREFYFIYLKLPWPEYEEDQHTPHEIDDEVLSVFEIYHPLDEGPTGLIILRDHQIIDIVDIPGGEHIRITLTPNTVVLPPAPDSPEAFVQLAKLILAEIQQRCGQAMKTLDERDYRLTLSALSGLEHPLVYVRTKIRELLRSALPSSKPKPLNQ